jgi:hypothetical protein
MLVGIILYTYSLYRVIHKSVKHFKNSQQIDYATDHGNSYTDRERNSPKFFYIFLRCSMCLLGVCEGHCLCASTSH